MGVLLVSADNKVKEIPVFDESKGLQDLASSLRVAYILIFIAALGAFILSIAYAGHDSVWTASEWIHGAIYLVTFVLLIIGTIYTYLALNGINNPELEGMKNGVTGYLWAALLMGLFSSIGLIATGSGRAGYNAIRSESTQRIADMECRVKEIHSRALGGEVSVCDCPPPPPPPPCVPVQVRPACPSPVQVRPACPPPIQTRPCPPRSQYSLVPPPPIPPCARGECPQPKPESAYIRSMNNTVNASIGSPNVMTGRIAPVIPRPSAIPRTESLASLSRLPTGSPRNLIDV